MRLLLLAVIWIYCYGCSPSATISNSQENQKENSEETFKNLIENIRLVLNESDNSVRVYFSGECGQGAELLFQEVSFPKIRLTQPVSGNDDIIQIRSIFHKNEPVKVFQDRNGIIRVRIGDPDDKLLKTNISVLRFTPDEQYNSRLAVDVIDDAPEVIEMAENIRVRPTSRLALFGLLVAPSEEFPRLPEVVENVTMDEALDLVASTLGDIIVFGICSDQYTVRAYGRR